MKKYKLIINNLDCANCARILEENLNKTQELNNVTINFNTKILTYNAQDEIPLTKLNKLIQTIEPDAYATKEEIEQKQEFHLTILIIGTILGLISIYTEISNPYKTIILIISYTLLLYRTFINSCNLLIKRRIINENLLITISCIGAYLVNEPTEGIMVIFLYTIGKILENKAINKSRKSIKGIIDIKQNYANLKKNNKTVKIKVEEIKINDTLVVKKGEKIPTDSIIIKGNTKLDTSAITGESDPLEVKEKDKVLSGTINIGNVIEVKALNIFEESTVYKILELVEQATDKKTKTETLVSKISRIYTPAVLIISIIIAITTPLIFKINYPQSIYRALTFLVISCPCAIAISVPLSYFTGIGIASKNGILIKGSNYLDNLAHINKMIFDKTGTLTNASFTVTNIEIIDNNYTKEQLIDIITQGESLSNHPIAKSIIKLTNKQIDTSKIKRFQEIEGNGISYILDNNQIKIGNKNLCNCKYDSILHVNINDKHIASITINDGIKDNAYETIQKLKENNIKTYLFTGDKKEIALTIGKKLNIDEIAYEMLPTDKYYKYEKIEKPNDTVAFIGDGINDAPVLKRANIGISLGNIGSESAIESSDIVLTNDDLSKIPLAINISKYTNKIVKQNLIFALSIKLLILLLSIFGLTNMWFAVFADTGLTLLTIINTLRISKKFNT